MEGLISGRTVLYSSCWFFHAVFSGTHMTATRLLTKNEMISFIFFLMSLQFQCKNNNNNNKPNSFMTENAFAFLLVF